MLEEHRSDEMNCVDSFAIVKAFCGVGAWLALWLHLYLMHNRAAMKKRATCWQLHLFVLRRAIETWGGRAILLEVISMTLHNWVRLTAEDCVDLIAHSWGGALLGQGNHMLDVMVMDVVC